MLFKTFAVGLIFASRGICVPVLEEIAGAVDSPILDDSAWAINDTIPSPPELAALLDAQEARSSGGLEARQWVSDNNFRLYHYHSYQQWCDPRNHCQEMRENSIVRRDNCIWDNCNPQRKLDVMKTAEGFCDKLFTACRVANARWRLRLRQTGDHNSCRIGASIVLSPGPHLGTYASLHDDANGRHIGWCWYDNEHRFTEFCSGIPFNLNSLIRCGWM